MSSNVLTPPVVAEEKPENGFAGLKHWRADIVAGLIVSLVSVPLSLGIAIASGAPPIAGLISSIIAGLLFPFLGGAFVTISGPAAGLAPVVLIAIVSLGKGDMQTGYHLCLAVICMAGLMQLVASRCKLARFCNIFPASAVQGMLAAIGMLIIAKQLPNFIGHPFRAHEFFPMIFEAPSKLYLLDPKVVLISVVSLGILIALSAIKTGWIKKVPPQLIAVIAGIVLGKYLGLDTKCLVHIPADFFGHGITMPDFGGLLNQPGLWVTALSCAITLTLVDGVESLATIMAVDKIDPYRRTSNPDRTLFAMGVSNICSSLVGGLTIIPGGIKSTTCIVSGGRTLWANFYNALFLLFYVLVAREVINLIPLGTLAAILMHIGYKLCAAHKWINVQRIGPEQLVIFSGTIIATLLTDLLWGLFFGTMLKLLIVCSVVFKANISSGKTGVESLKAAVTSPFRNPVVNHHREDNTHFVRFDGPLVCFNALQVRAELGKVPSDIRVLRLQFSDNVCLIDHSSHAHLRDAIDAQKFGVEKMVILEGFDHFKTRSSEKRSMCTGEMRKVS